jgi:hypothetical protein
MRDCGECSRARLRGRALLACYRRHPIAGCVLDGDAVHRALDAQLDLHRLLHHEERDLLIDVWSRDPRSDGEREGLA